jgi:hypothetical protein
MTRRRTSLPWPFLKTYRNEFLDKVSLPVGGIGTGTVGFSGNGGFRDWEIMNVPGKGYTPGAVSRLSPSLLVRTRMPGETPSVRLLEGPIPLSEYQGAEGAAFPNAGFPRFTGDILQGSDNCALAWKRTIGYQS